MTATIHGDTETAPAIDFSAFDHRVRVQDDLYRHVNGTWLSETEIPSDKSITGSFIALRDVAEQAVRAIITELGRRRSAPAPAANAPRSPTLYASFIDVERVEELGLEPASHRSWPASTRSRLRRQI